MSDSTNAILPISDEAFQPIVANRTQISSHDGCEVNFSSHSNGYAIEFLIQVTMPAIDLTNVQLTYGRNGGVIDNLEFAWVLDSIVKAIKSVAIKGTDVDSKEKPAVTWTASSMLNAIEYAGAYDNLAMAQELGNCADMIEFTTSKSNYTSSFKFPFLISRETPFLIDNTRNVTISITPDQVYNLIRIRGTNPDGDVIELNMKEHGQLSKQLPILHKLPDIETRLKYLDSPNLSSYLNEAELIDGIKNRYILQFSEPVSSKPDVYGTDHQLTINCADKPVAGVVWCVVPVQSDRTDINIGCNELLSMGVENVISSTVIDPQPGEPVKLHHTMTNKYCGTVSRRRGYHIHTFVEQALSDYEVECPKLNNITLTCSVNPVDIDTDGLYLSQVSSVERYVTKYKIVAYLIIRTHIKYGDKKINFTI